MTSAEPIRDDELAGLFAETIAFPIAIAVSGGADSVALLFLMQRWMHAAGIPDVAADGRPNAMVLSVDHKLRPGSTREAEWAGELSRRLGFRHEILTWHGEKPETGIQESARDARYALFRECIARETGAPRILVTAHHQDDQAETLLMRLARGSGLDGLAGMRTLSTSYGLAIARPLLGVPKARLVATLAALGESYIDDPSNANERFERVRLRNAASTLSDLGLDNVHVALSARRLARAREALEAATHDLAVRSNLNVHSGAFASLDRAAFAKSSEELQLRLLALLIARFGGQATQTSLAKIEELCARLPAKESDAVTLGGAVVSLSPQHIEVCREMGRAGLESILLRAGECKIWDGRFAVTFQGTEDTEEVSVGALGEEGWRSIRPSVEAPQMPQRALLTLPAFRAFGEVVAVPLLRFSEPNDDRKLCVARFIWPPGMAVWPNS